MSEISREKQQHSKGLMLFKKTASQRNKIFLKNLPLKQKFLKKKEHICESNSHQIFTNRNKLHFKCQFGVQV